MVGWVTGLEPATSGSTIRRSTPELHPPLAQPFDYNRSTAKLIMIEMQTARAAATRAEVFVRWRCRGECWRPRRWFIGVGRLVLRRSIKRATIRGCADETQPRSLPGHAYGQSASPRGSDSHDVREGGGDSGRA